MNALATAILSVWASFGVRIDDLKDTPGSLTIFISVPNYSEIKNVHGEAMSGGTLARTIKEKFSPILPKPLSVKYRVRAGELWTREMGAAAERQMRSTLNGIQF